MINKLLRVDISDVVSYLTLSLLELVAFNVVNKQFFFASFIKETSETLVQYVFSDGKK